MEKTKISNEAKNAIVTASKNISDIFAEDYAEQFKVVSGDKVAYKVEYNLYNKVKDHQSLKLTDKDMINSTEKIRIALSAGEKLKKVLCREIYNLSQNDKLEKLGFKTVASYCKAMFDMATSTAGLYSQIGQYFINEYYDDVIDETEYLKVGHLLELLPLVDKDTPNITPIKRLERVIDAFNAGDINDMMSTKAMRQAIKDNYPEFVESKKGKSKKVAKNSSDNSESTEEKSNEEPLDDIMRGARVVSDLEYFKRLAVEKDVDSEILQKALDLITSLISE